MSNRDNYADHRSRRTELAPAPDAVEDEATACGLDLPKAWRMHLNNLG